MLKYKFDETTRLWNENLIKQPAIENENLMKLQSGERKSW